MLTSEERILAKTIFRLIKEATNQKVVKDFLKDRNIPYSASNWDELFLKRIEPALNDKNISLKEIRELLQSVEEYGSQHCFLFSCHSDKAKMLINKDRVERIAKDNGLENLFETPLDLELPENPTIVDLRMVDTTQLIIKVVEARKIKKLLSEETDPETGDLIKRYSVRKKRAVSIANLASDGFLELRIASQDNQTRYRELVQTMLKTVSKFIPIDSFSEYSLHLAKAKIYNDRSLLSKDFRYSYSVARNDLGATMQLSSSSQNDDLSEDSGSMEALDKFLFLDGYITGTNVFVKTQNGDNPPNEVHLIISGEINEFAIPAACSKGEYAYVREKIISLNT